MNDHTYADAFNMYEDKEGKSMITVQKDWFEQTEIECFIAAVHYPGNNLKGILPLVDESLDGQITELIKSGYLSILIHSGQIQ